MKRGPRYGAYARLRESRLRMKNGVSETVTPPAVKKQVRFQGSPAATGRKGSSILAQSVPDFSATLRKENRRPIDVTTPPAKNWGKMNGSDLRGSRSAGAGEKRVGRGGARKSYANVEEFRGLSSGASRAINDAGENRAGGRRTVLGSYKLF